MDGILVIDKSGGMTSRDVVNRVQRWFPRRTKIGHTGTLDPLATGVLVVCVGAATRLADYVQAMPKSYASRFRLGATSSTDDADGDVVIHSDAVLPSSATVAAALAAFVGTIDQVPPAFSALKLQGKRAHELARKGQEVRLEARPVRIDAVRMIAYEWPFLDVEIDCGKGTYIRSIARDFGAALGCGAMVETLQRTRIGPFRVEDGVTLEIDPAEARRCLRPMEEAVAGLPVVELPPGDEAAFRTGQTVPFGNRPLSGEVCVKGADDRFLGVGVIAGGRVKPDRVIARSGPPDVLR
jgi:tRNA pseudouridine55 synthase